MIDHTEPRPRTDAFTAVDDFRWPVAGVWDTPVFDPKGVSSSFDHVATTRECIRTLNPAMLADVMSLIRYVFAYKDADAGQQHKRVMSAGAIHPIYPIILPKQYANEQPILYQADRDIFVELVISDASKIQEGDLDVRTILPDADAHAVLLAGDKARVDAHYLNTETLLLRDTGVALQMLALTASACGLGLCPLGILGIDSLKGVLGDQERIVPLGMFVVGLPRSA